MQRISRTAGLLFGLWLFLYGSFALLSPPLLDDVDAVHAEISREMILRGDPVTLHINGIRYLEKAPLLYWSMAASMRAFGVGTSAARLPLALFALALFLLTAAFARRCFQSERSALYAGGILLLSFGLFLFTRILIPDAIVCLWYTAALFFFWQTEMIEDYGYPDLKPCIGFAAMCALNVLTKGLTGALFPVLAVVFYLLVTRGFVGTFKRVWQLHPFLSTIAFAALAAPWHVLAARANPTEGHPAGAWHTGRLWPHVLQGWHVGVPAEGAVHGWTWYYFVNEYLLRYVHLRLPRDHDSVPVFVFWVLIAVWLMPWSAYLIHAVAALPWRALRHRSTATGMYPEQRALVFLLIAAVVPVVFLSFTTRQVYYVLPALPFLAMLIARWLDREAQEVELNSVTSWMARSGTRISTVLFYAGAILAFVCGYLATRALSTMPGTDLATLLHQNTSIRALAAGHVPQIDRAALGMFRDSLVLAAISIFVGTCGGWWFRRNDNPHHANLVLALGMAGTLVAAHKGLTTFAPVLTSEQLAAQVAPLLRPSNLLVINDEYEAGASLGFYLQRANVHILHGRSSDLWYGSFFRNAPNIFESDTSIQLKWIGPERIFLWTTPGKTPSLPGPVYVVAALGGKELLTNKLKEEFVVAPGGINEIPPETLPELKRDYVPNAFDGSLSAAGTEVAPNAQTDLVAPPSSARDRVRPLSPLPPTAPTESALPSIPQSTPMPAADPEAPTDLPDVTAPPEATPPTDLTAPAQPSREAPTEPEPELRGAA